MRRTILSTLLTAALLVPVGAAYAAPQDDQAELSQTIQVAWLMPGPFTGYATFPQTYLPGGVPECGTGGVQVDIYKYGTDEVRALVEAEVEKANRGLAPVEQVRAFRLLEKELDHDDDEVTATMKVRRKTIYEKFAPLIRDIYGQRVASGESRMANCEPGVSRVSANLKKRIKKSSLPR